MPESIPSRRPPTGPEPGVQTVSRWLSGAPHGCVTLPTLGDDLLVRFESAEASSAPVPKRVRDSMPYGRNGGVSGARPGMVPAPPPFLPGAEGAGGRARRREGRRAGRHLGGQLEMRAEAQGVAVVVILDDEARVGQLCLEVE